MSENKKHAGGRPLKYKTVKELEAAINEYFDHCDNRIVYEYSKTKDDVVERIKPEPYTMAGLAYALDMDRKSLLNYENRDEFFLTIKRARSRVQIDVERRLMDGTAVAGAIFNLKNNFGYHDQTQVEQSGTVEIVTRKHSSKG